MINSQIKINNYLIFIHLKFLTFYQIMNKKFLLVPIVLVSILWQPIHHYLMNSGINMTPEVHSLITMSPFLAILLILSKVVL